jgi:hypothetical protein
MAFAFRFAGEYKEMNTIILLLPLLLLVTPVIAHATNERSYKFGFSVGFSDYNHCFDNDADALDCSPPDSSNPLAICVGNPNNQAVTNSTACIDGYVQGWQCKSDTKDCVDFWSFPRWADIWKECISWYRWQLHQTTWYTAYTGQTINST